MHPSIPPKGRISRRVAGIGSKAGTSFPSTLKDMRNTVFLAFPVRFRLVVPFVRTDSSTLLTLSRVLGTTLLTLSGLTSVNQTVDVGQPAPRNPATVQSMGNLMDMYLQRYPIDLITA